MLELLKQKNVQWAVAYFILGSICNFMSFNTSNDILNTLGNIILGTLAIVLIMYSIRLFKGEC